MLLHVSETDHHQHQLGPSMLLKSFKSPSACPADQPKLAPRTVFQYNLPGAAVRHDSSGACRAAMAFSGSVPFGFQSSLVAKRQQNADSTQKCCQTMCPECQPAWSNACLCALQETWHQTSSMPRESSATAAQQAASPTLAEAASLVTDHVNRLRGRVMQELEVEDRQVLAGAGPCVCLTRCRSRCT